MAVSNSEVGYTSATRGRGDHEVHKGYVVRWGKETFYQKQKSKICNVQCPLLNPPWGKNARLKHLGSPCDRRLYDIRMIILLKEVIERMSINTERQSATGCTYRFYVLLREFYKKGTRFLATKQACLNYVPNVCRHCQIALAWVSTEAPQYLQK
jgi:hypothetical protein